jgi:hypothetical protein
MAQPDSQWWGLGAVLPVLGMMILLGAGTRAEQVHAALDRH